MILETFREEVYRLKEVGQRKDQVGTFCILIHL